MNNQSWRKRINVLVIVFILMALGIGYRLFSKQVLEHNNFLALAEEQYIVKKDLPALRGKIYFSDMFPAATNSRTYQVLAIPRQIEDKNVAAEKLAPLLDIKESDLLATIDNDKYYVPPLKKRLTEEEGQKIANEKI